jgi:hypothetical protein
MSVICFNITASVLHHNWEEERALFSSIHQEIDAETPPAGSCELVSSFLAGLFLPAAGYALPSPIGPLVGTSIIICNVYCCTKPISESEDRKILGWYRTSKVACLALNKYSHTQIHAITTGSQFNPITTNDLET